MTVAHQLARARSDRLAGRLVRCFAVSMLTTAISLATLALLTVSLHITAWTANVAATALGTVVSYRLNRRWVWSRRDPSNPWREVLPFWVLSFGGLALSTGAVALADHWATTAGLSGALHTLTVLTASVAGFAALWIAQFAVLERVLFAEHVHPDHPTHPAKECHR